MVNSKDEINSYFDILINEVGLDKEIKNLTIYKKGLYNSDFVDENQSLHRMEPHNIGYQEWTNNQLTYLYLGNNVIETLPDSIGLLRGLLNLDLRENQIKTLPEDICNIVPSPPHSQPLLC